MRKLKYELVCVLYDVQASVIDKTSYGRYLDLRSAKLALRSKALDFKSSHVVIGESFRSSQHDIIYTGDGSSAHFFIISL